MIILRDIMTVVLFLAFLFIATCTAEIVFLNLRFNTRHSILFSKFGFSHTGHVTVEISSVAVTSTLSQPAPSRIGFFLLSHDLLNDYRFNFQQNPNMCVLDSGFISVLFTLQDVYAHPNSSFNRSYQVSSPDVYRLYFANCNRKSFVTMNVRLELYNTYNNNTTKDYLSAGLTHLPSLYLVFSLIYFCFLGFWIYICLKNQHDIHMIHFVMGLLLVATFGYFICGAADQHDLKVTGTRDDRWSAWFYTFQLIRFVILYTVIVLIGNGWSLWNPFLKEKEKLLLMIVILLGVLVNVPAISAGATGPYNEKQFDWESLSFVLDLMFCFVIFVPLVWSGLVLRKTCETDENSVQILEKLGSFVVAVVVYVIFTRLVVRAIVATFVEYKTPLVIHAADETCSLVFCMVMFDLFRPCLRVNRQLPWYVRLFNNTSRLSEQDPEKTNRVIIHSATPNLSEL